MTYRYSLERLLDVLSPHASRRVHAIRKTYRAVEWGLLSVGLKLHCLDAGEQFSHIIETLGGRSEIIACNHYRQAAASLCWVLPPVGSARIAIALLEAIEQATAYPIFDNPLVQIQVCSPGRLRERRAALLSIGFYLGSDVIRQLSLTDLETTFSDAQLAFRRGRRITIYDAGGDFDRGFAWWMKQHGTFIVTGQLPFHNGRTDVLMVTSRMDIENVNLIATLLTHVQYGGYWHRLGVEFECEFAALLKRHDLAHLLEAPWIVTDKVGTLDDLRFSDGMRELMAYASEEAARVRKMQWKFWRTPHEERGILWDMQQLLERYRVMMHALADNVCKKEGGGQ